MAKEIAVFIGTDGSSASLYETGRVTVFRRAGGSWVIDRVKDLSIGQVKGMHELRQIMAGMISFLGECRIFVAKSAAGVPFFELEKAGCGVWEITGRPLEFLQHVWDEEEKEHTQNRSPAPISLPVPEEKMPGYFYISLKEIQGKNADISSKQVLQHFIRKGEFRTLVATCSHIPPWIEIEAAGNGLLFEAEQSGQNEFTIRVSKR